MVKKSTTRTSSGRAITQTKRYPSKVSPPQKTTYSSITFDNDIVPGIVLILLCLTIFKLRSKLTIYKKIL